MAKRAWRTVRPDFGNTAWEKAPDMQEEKIGRRCGAGSLFCGNGAAKGTGKAECPKRQGGQGVQGKDWGKLGRQCPSVNWLLQAGLWHGIINLIAAICVCHQENVTGATVVTGVTAT